MWSGWGRGAKVRRELRRVLPDLKGVRLPDLRRVHLPELKDLHLPDLQAPEIDWGRGRMGSRVAALWPALFAAAGAGAAVWWWNQWARGRAEAEAAEAGDAGLAPTRTPAEERSAVDAAGGAAGAASPASIMAHAPEEDAPNGSGEPVETLAPHVRAALDESLSVQAAAESASGAASAR